MPEQPHDHFFKTYFGRFREAALGLLLTVFARAALAGFRVDHFTQANVELVDRRLGRKLADLLFEVHLRPAQDPPDGACTRLFVLFGHQSTVDRTMPHRDGAYIFRIWDRWDHMERQQRKRQEGRAPPRNEAWLPAVIPVVIYHGERQWPPVELSELIELPPELRSKLGPYLPSLRPMVDDLTVATDEEILAQGPPLTALGRLALKHGARSEEIETCLKAWMGTIAEALRQPSGRDALETMFEYILRVNERADPERLADLLASGAGEPAREVVMTAGERLIAQGEAIGLEKGEAIGFEKGETIGFEKGETIGFEKGEAVGKRQILLKQLSLKFRSVPPEIVERVGAASATELDRWSERILFVSDLGELFSEPDRG